MFNLQVLDEMCDWEIFNKFKDLYRNLITTDICQFIQWYDESLFQWLMHCIFFNIILLTIQLSPNFDQQSLLNHKNLYE